jgi:hypothetical protein
MVALDLSEWSATGADISEQSKARLYRALDRLIAVL